MSIYEYQNHQVLLLIDYNMILFQRYVFSRHRLMKYDGLFAWWYLEKIVAITGQGLQITTYFEIKP